MIHDGCQRSAARSESFIASFKWQMVYRLRTTYLTAHTLIVNHHATTAFPCRVNVYSTIRYGPSATSTALAHAIYVLLLAESASARRRVWLNYLFAMGAIGHLGTGFEWAPPFQDMHELLEEETKMTLRGTIALGYARTYLAYHPSYIADV